MSIQLSSESNLEFLFDFLLIYRFSPEFTSEGFVKVVIFHIEVLFSHPKEPQGLFFVFLQFLLSKSALKTSV